MKDILVLMIFVLACGFGFFVLTKFDVFLGKVHDCIPKTCKEKILIVGDRSKLSSFLKSMNESNIEYDISSDGYYDENVSYQALFAFSDNDILNLTLCTYIKGQNKDAFTLALCNERIYERIFARKNVDKIAFEIPSLNNIFYKEHFGLYGQNKENKI